ncbi:hypothetical protein [Pseudomonas sp. TE3610]
MGTIDAVKAGELDPSFGVKGRLVLPEVFSEDVSHLLAGQDGAFYVAGRISHWDGFEFLSSEYVIAKFDAEGVQDLSFGVDGVVVANFDPQASSANYATLFVQGDHLLVLGKDGTNKEAMFGAARFTFQGTPDRNFGNNGALALRLQDIVGETTAVLHPHVFSAVAEDGKMLLASTLHYPDSSFHPIVVRLTPDGALDRSWDARGYKVIVVEQPGAFFSRLQGIHTDGDKVIVSANYDAQGNATGDKNYMARFNADGSIDRTFGLDGLFLFPPASLPSAQPDTAGSELFPFPVRVEKAEDKVWPLLRIVSSQFSDQSPHYLATGTKFRYTPRKWAGLIIGLDRDGQYDREFNDGNAVIVDPDPEGAYINQCILQPGSEGLIIAAGSRDWGTLLARYTPDGALDRTFGDQGYVIMTREGSSLPIFSTQPAIIRTAQTLRLLINFWDDEGRVVIDAYTL